MKNILFTLALLVSFSSFGQKTSFADFTISEEFIEANEQTFLELLIDATLLVKMSTKERMETILRIKETTRAYIRNANNEENILINKSELGPSKQLLEMIRTQIEYQTSQRLEGIKVTLLDSGFGNYQNKFDYIFFQTLFDFDGSDRYSCQYIISVRNENFHIIINTKEGLEIQDVFNDIN